MLNVFNLFIAVVGIPQLSGLPLGVKPPFAPFLIQWQPHLRMIQPNIGASGIADQQY